MPKLLMYKCTFKEKHDEAEPFSVWRLAQDSEDAAWQCNEIARGSQWQLMDIELDEKEEVLPEQLAGLQRL